MSNTKISTRARNAALRQCQSIIGAAKVWYSANPDPSQRTWENLERRIGVVIDTPYKTDPRNGGTIPLTYQSLQAWCQYYLASLDARLAQAVDGPVAKSKSDVAFIKDLDDKRTVVGSFTLLPEQESVYRALIRDFFIGNPNLVNNYHASDKINAAYQDGGTGSGKTVLSMALIKYIIDNKLDANHLLYPIIILTRPTLMENWHRHLEQAGLGTYIGNKILVTAYSQLSARFGQMFVQEEEDIYTEKITVKWNPGLVPYIIFLDEAHALNNDSKQSRAIQALLTGTHRTCRAIFLSATPFITVNNSKTFVLAVKPTFMGMKVNAENFNQFAQAITDEPSKPNTAAAKRLREILGQHIYSFPRVKWPHKAINQVMLCDFENEKDREFTQAAYERYLEFCSKMGKSTEFGQFERFIMLGQLKKAVEPVRCNQIVRACHEDLMTGNYATAVGVCYRDTIIKMIFEFIKLGYKREDISVIWGGKDEIKSNLILTRDQVEAMLKRDVLTQPFTRFERKCLEATLLFKEDKERYQEKTDAETMARHQMLGSLGLLGNQSPNKRQIEIDNFQAGRSRICLFTLAAGGVGLSLDHCSPNLLPRKGYFTPSYSGPELKQALGRLLRRMTLSDVYQYIVGMRGSVEETHVMPLIDMKLQCLGIVTDSYTDMIDFSNKASFKLRDKTQAEADAENEDSQLHDVGDSDETNDDPEDI